jgi:methanogenic corrinoid protein MtbC1
MHEILEKLTTSVEFGKINKNTPFPPDMKGQDGADELTKNALEAGISPSDILNNALIVGMDRVGKKFSEHKVFVPQMLLSAKAMAAAMVHMKPFFQSGDIKRKGIFVIGTVTGDLHDIGKNLVSMMVEGSGWEVKDLGVDVKTDRFLDAIKENPGCFLGLSSLLTTTMGSMENIVKSVKEKYPDIKICIGGAPVNENFRKQIEADFYSPNPQGLIEYLNNFAA